MLRKTGLKFIKAYLDIWLPNVCYKPDGTPVLIDFDRSWINAESRALVHILKTRSPNSVLYQLTVELFQS